MGRWVNYFILFALMVGLQVLVFSHIQFRGMANAFPYVFFIIALPFGMSGRTVLILSALLGFAVDFLSGTLGVHMAAAVFAGYIRMMLLPALAPQGDYEVGTSPSVRDNGWGWFLRFSVIMVLAHHTVLFFVESFTFVNIGVTLFNIMVSSIFSIAVISIFQTAVRKSMA
ncbi:MAG: hypothetical protein PF444_06915 [Bacteroidales bacterium]|jgi:hypothetical protein|nr:hypothetical protein [Bacteroidales bacterium]